MSEKFAIVGSWDWEGNRPKGIHLFEYQDKKMTHITSCLADVKVANKVVKGKDNVFYFVDERKNSEDRSYGGGGYVYAAKLNREAKRIDILSKQKSLAVNPSGCTITHNGKYLLVVHHTSTKDTATRLIRRSDGSISSEVIDDDAAIVSFQLNEDGSILKAVDFDVKGKNGKPSVIYAAYTKQLTEIYYPDGKPSLLHAIYTIPNKNIYVVCDKGLDSLYSYTIDVQNGKLTHLNTLKLPEGSAPRYCAFHPYMPLFYVNNETKDVLYVCCYDSTGKLTMIDEIMLHKEKKLSFTSMASDLILLPKKKELYVILRTTDQIVHLHINDKGIPILSGCYESYSGQPRGIAVNEEETQLYVCNTEKDKITDFDIFENGSLRKSGTIEISRPANMIFVE